MTRSRLTADLLDDDWAVLSLVDVLFEHHVAHERRTRRILAAQDRLQVLTSEDAWIAYLDLEQLVNERTNMMLATVARWAFTEGCRNRRG